MGQARPIVWQPSAERAAQSRMAAYIDWLAQNRDLTFADYPALWDWSVTEIEAFWETICQFFDIPMSKPYTSVLKKRVMPGADWFDGAALNYIDAISRYAVAHPQDIALISQSETFGRSELTWGALHQQISSVASHLTDMGVEKGDRVVAVLPNTPASIIACLATASLGAIWSLCAPDMGHTAIVDRFSQIEPKVLITQDSYVHGGKTVDRSDVIKVVADSLPTVTHHIEISAKAGITWAELLHRDVPLTPLQVPFSHPLWVVYSSGTTGNPKPIVHGHGGVLLEAAKQSLHQDLKAGERFCWLTSSGWIMWNVQLAALAQGMTVCMFDGAPNHPDWSAVWDFASKERLNYFGAGAAFFASCGKEGITPAKDCDLSALHSLGSTGSPLSEDAYDWIYSAVKPDIWLAPISGGTDFAGAFVCGNPMLPVRKGEMQARALGNAVRAFDVDGNEVIGEVGELVCTEPLPSMPLFFWGDTDGSRLHDSYFDTYPNVWRHGDWIEITSEGGSVIYGRSDATINRKGLRLGSSEIYQAVEGLDVVLDSLVIDLEFLGRDSFMPLFVVLRDGHRLDDTLKAQINAAIKRDVSARFQPNEIIQVAEIPRTLSGKKLEVPVKKLLLGGDPAKVVNRDSMANPDSFDTFIAYAAERQT
ncbi:acetoacetate--CoA ligase [Amylibacter sp. IMCC11727]|uniref:acetoacetate--CoA ligase n=1 Tax=Amylibacter sp. IMCC11727 TaxID=3039851 RepID=UPI00244DEBB5|nr:acetoacetate--CoA ligase [Amylibacter sp. IMCC11727]WGI23208.1 acetoacetate--CoA ligase [Amylibacter sp. IMCC11727]